MFAGTHRLSEAQCERLPLWIKLDCGCSNPVEQRFVDAKVCGIECNRRRRHAHFNEDRSTARKTELGGIGIDANVIGFGLHLQVGVRLRQRRLWSATQKQAPGQNV